MQIAGIVKNSFVDYPGKISFVVFTRDCNMDCYFCHNRHFFNSMSSCEYNTENILWEIRQRKMFIDCIVISGGEPLLQTDLSEFIDKVKSMGLLIKLDTNGLLPEKLLQMIDKIDYIAMDIKATFEKYPAVTNVNLSSSVFEKKIQNSINVIKNSGKEHEFRTTLIPEITLEDFKKMYSYVGDSPYYIQKYLPKKNHDSNSTNIGANIIQQIKELKYNNIYFRGF